MAAMVRVRPRGRAARALPSASSRGPWAPACASGLPPPSSPHPLELYEAAGVPPSARFVMRNGARAGPGLRRLEKDVGWFESCGDAEEWRRQMETRRGVLAASRPDEGPLVWDGAASEAAEELWESATAWLARRYPARYERDAHGNVRMPALGVTVERASGLGAFVGLASIVQEDIFLMRADADHPEGHVFKAGASVFSFDPVKRKDKGLLSLHAPVPWYPSMAKAVRRAFDNLDADKPLYRANFAFQNTDELITTDVPWHPRHGDRSDDPGLDAAAGHTSYFDTTVAVPDTPEAVAEAMHVRVEYETLSRLPSNSEWILFTVKTYVDRLSDFPPEAKAALLAGLRRADDGQRAYKSLDNPAVFDAVVAYLDM